MDNSITNAYLSLKSVYIRVVLYIDATGKAFVVQECALQNLNNPVVCYPSFKTGKIVSWKAKPLQWSHSIIKYCGGGAGGGEE